MIGRFWLSSLLILALVRPAWAGGYSPRPNQKEETSEEEVKEKEEKEKQSRRPVRRKPLEEEFRDIKPSPSQEPTRSEGNY